MSIDIAHIAKLARLKVDDGEILKFEKDMQAIIDMVDKLPDVQGEIILDKNNAMSLREDVAVPNKFTRDELVANAPVVQAGCLVVPKTVE